MMLTSCGEVRHYMDLLVSEGVVDSKLYLDGYGVQVKLCIEKAQVRIMAADRV